MKLYEINAAIDDLYENAIDADTGEMLVDPEEFSKQLEELSMQRQEKLENIAKLILNTKAEAKAYEDEERRFHAKRQHAEKKVERFKNWLAYECHGEKTDLGVATVSYLRTKALNVNDNATAVEWLQMNHPECVKYTAPEVNKAEVKSLLKSGEMVPGCEIVENTSCMLK